MRRNMKLIMRILKHLADRNEPWVNGSGIHHACGANENDLDATVFDYHIELCVQAGFVVHGLAEDRTPLPTYQLTWAGHEWLAGRRTPD